MIKNDILIMQIAEKHDVTIDQILSHRRDRKYVTPRIEIAKALRKQGLSLPAIGKIMNRDHTSIIHYLRKA